MTHVHDNHWYLFHLSVDANRLKDCHQGSKQYPAVDLVPEERGHTQQKRHAWTRDNMISVAWLTCHQGIAEKTIPRPPERLVLLGKVVICSSISFKGPFSSHFLFLVLSRRNRLLFPLFCILDSSYTTIALLHFHGLTLPNNVPGSKCLFR